MGPPIIFPLRWDARMRGGDCFEDRIHRDRGASGMFFASSKGYPDPSWDVVRWAEGSGWIAFELPLGPHRRKEVIKAGDVAQLRVVAIARMGHDIAALKRPASRRRRLAEHAFRLARCLRADPVDLIVDIAAAIPLDDDVKVGLLASAARPLAPTHHARLQLMARLRAQLKNRWAPLAVSDS